VRPNPKPGYRASGLDADGAIIFGYASHPVILHFLEMQRRVPMVCHPETVILVGQPLNFRRELMVEAPEPGRGSELLVSSRTSRRRCLVLAGVSDSQCVWLDLEETEPSKRFKMTRRVIADDRSSAERQ
jgi:hypothetical protein